VGSPPGATAAPVLIVIHGGGFPLVSGAHPAFDGAVLAASGVVVVTFNYRLGLLGFAGGSHWLTDQIAALRWVRSHIARFGGDPGNVTIAGASAGGVSVNALNIAPSARGLFRQAISISGGGDNLFARPPHPPIPDRSAYGEPPVYDTAFASGAGEYAAVDGALIPAFPSEALRAGRSNAGRLIFAFSDFEASMLDQMGTPPEAMAAAMRDLAPEAERRPVEPDGYALYSHCGFRRPALDLADAASAAGLDVRVLDYGFVPTAGRARLRGAAHGAALYDILGTTDPLHDELGLVRAAGDEAFLGGLRRRILGLLTSADPASAAQWPRYRVGEATALRIDAAGDARIGHVRGLQDLAALAHPDT
ncbi:MAG: carboxylesterase family protein, partial [Phenylobacterium sp.]|nr:carboxylesterase family protein [Phenylobacterium sp.]